MTFETSRKAYEAFMGLYADRLAQELQDELHRLVHLERPMDPVCVALCDSDQQDLFTGPIR